MTKEQSSPYTSNFFDEIEDGSIRSGRLVLPILLDLLAPRSIVDVGCGRGAWLHAALELGVTDVDGIDGSYVTPDTLLIPPERFHSADLSRPFAIPGQYDLAICLEVGEHLPGSAAAPLVETLTNAAPAVLFSAAIPGQQGTHHINEQFPEYWFELFSRRGYLPLDVIRPRIAWDTRIEPWYAQNALLYVDRNYYTQTPGLQQWPPIQDPDLLLPWVRAGIWRGRVKWRGPLALAKLMLQRALR